jgi:hypothetical protein
MAIYKHVSSKEIIRKVFRDIKPATADFVHDAIEWIGEALEHIGASAQLCTKQAVIPIANHKGNLPGDLYYINQVAINTCVSSTVGLQINTILDQIQDLNSNILEYSEQLSCSTISSSISKGGAPSDSTTATYYGDRISGVSASYIVDTTAGAAIDRTDLAVDDAAAALAGSRYASAAIGKSGSNATITTTCSSINDLRVASNNQLRDLNVNLQMLTGMYFNQGSCLQPLQYGASTFHKGSHCDQCVNEITKYKETYVINCGLIQTSFETGYVCLSYTAFPTDDECFPMVPDDISFREAMFWYIYKKLLLQGIPGRNQKIGYDYAELMWQNYCTQARNAANYPDIDKYESFLNQWVRLTPNINSHQYFFETMNDREQFTEDNF